MMFCLGLINRPPPVLISLMLMSMLMLMLLCNCTVSIENHCSLACRLQTDQAKDRGQRTEDSPAGWRGGATSTSTEFFYLSSSSSRLTGAISRSTISQIDIHQSDWHSLTDPVPGRC